MLVPTPKNYVSLVPTTYYLKTPANTDKLTYLVTNGNFVYIC